MGEKVAVLGMGYVGLPVALAFGHAGLPTIGFDVDPGRIADLNMGEDITKTATTTELRQTQVTFTTDPRCLQGRSLFIVAVPTPVTAQCKPDFGPLLRACRIIGSSLCPGGIVVIESTVYPGATEEICAPVLEQTSGLVYGSDFTLGYSPERINPGDSAHSLKDVVKVVAADNHDTLERLVNAYSQIALAGIHCAPSIKVAEAAKVLENTQRDINIALMNEFAIICDRMGLRSHDVLSAARTKWNFLPFTPGLVGGHCIGVDPYYLTACKAEMLGLHPEIVLAGRRLNDSMGFYVARRIAKLMIAFRQTEQRLRIGVLGLTFKKNVPDLRNSRVPDLIRELNDFGITTLAYDPLVSPPEVYEAYGIALVNIDDLHNLDGLVLAVPHHDILDQAPKIIDRSLNTNGLIADLCSVLDPQTLSKNYNYWSL